MIRWPFLNARVEPLGCGRPGISTSKAIASLGGTWRELEVIREFVKDGPQHCHQAEAEEKPRNAEGPCRADDAQQPAKRTTNSVLRTRPQRHSKG